MIKYQLLLIFSLAGFSSLCQSISNEEINQTNSSASQESESSKRFAPKLIDNTVFRKQVLDDISELEKPEWHVSYANLLISLQEEIKTEGVVYTNWSNWDSLLYVTANEFSKFSSFNREHIIYIVADPEANAFATEGGLIVVNVGFLADVGSFDEVRLVLGHEMGHVNYHHPYHGYVQARKAENRALAASVAGSLIGGVTGTLISHGITTTVYRRLMSHSREDESEADDFAGKAMLASNYSVANGVGFYNFISTSRDKYTYQTGIKVDGGLYGSSHPAPLNRHDILLEKYGSDLLGKSAKDNTEEFIKMRTRARLEKLRLLNADKSFRETIEFGWHYLLSDVGNKGIMQHMLHALDGLEKDGLNSFLTGKVLTDKYAISEELKTQIAQGNTTSEMAKGFIKTMLMVTNESLQSPFLYQITFGQLRQLLKAKLGEMEKIEADFVVAISQNEIDKDAIKFYVDNGGKYGHYAHYILNPDDYPMNRTLVLPLTLQSNSGVSEYQQRYKISDWTILLDELKKEQSNPTMVSLYDQSYVNEHHIEPLKLLSEIFMHRYKVHEVNVDLLELDIAISDWLVMNNVGNLFYFDYDSKSGYAKIETGAAYFDQGKILHAKYGLGSKQPLKPKHIPKAVRKVYKKMFKKRARTLD